MRGKYVLSCLFVGVGLVLSCVGLARLGFAWFRGAPGHVHGFDAHGARAVLGTWIEVSGSSAEVRGNAG